MKRHSQPARRAVAMSIMAAVLLTLVWLVVYAMEDKPDHTGDIAAGAIAPDFEATDTSGEKIRLSDYRGQVVLLNFWASWCKPCVRELPLFDEIRRSEADGIKVITVNAGESKGTVREFLSKLDLSMPTIIDAAGKITDAYRIVGLPATFVVDGDGVFVRVGLGELTSMKQIEAIVAEAQNRR